MSRSSPSMEKLLHLERPVPCSVIDRENRFVVNVQVDFEPARAHINNTGRLLEFMNPGQRAICLRHSKPLKTDYKLFAMEDRGRGAIIDTQLQMRAFERAIAEGLLPWLKGCQMINRNPRLGESVLDYALDCSGDEALVEVKSAALREGDFAMYPDCPSLRGRRHVRELAEHAVKGGRALLVFIAALPEVVSFRPCEWGDPEMPGLLQKAKEAGVELRAVSMHYNLEDSWIYLDNPDLPVKVEM